MWLAKEDYDKAVAELTEAIRLNPRVEGVYFSRGNAWLNKNEHDIAITDYTDAIRVNPKDTAAYNNRGVAWGSQEGVRQGNHRFQ